ncbi:MAG: hypothetical protein WDN66_04530 [Candidatus Saccharibacteria bacterium]
MKLFCEKVDSNLGDLNCIALSGAEDIGTGRVAGELSIVGEVVPKMSYQYQNYFLDDYA